MRAPRWLLWPFEIPGKPHAGSCAAHQELTNDPNLCDLHAIRKRAANPMVHGHSTRHQSAGHHSQTLRRRRPVSGLSNTLSTSWPFGAFFYGEFEDNFDDDKNNNKFNDRHIFTNQEDYEMRDDHMQFDFFIGLKCNSLKRKQMGSLGKQCSIVSDDAKRVEMGGKNASGVCVSARKVRATPHNCACGIPYIWLRGREKVHKRRRPRVLPTQRAF